MRYFYDSLESKLNARSGEEVEIIRPLTAEEVDLDEVGPMYKIKFKKDGFETDAFADELYTSRADMRKLEVGERFFVDGKERIATEVTFNPIKDSYVVCDDHDMLWTEDEFPEIPEPETDASCTDNTIPGTITLDPAMTYSLKIKDGYLDIRVSQDPEYPGLDIEYIANNEDKGSELKTRPRVLIECPKDTNVLRALIWGNPDNEDYSDSVEF